MFLIESSNRSWDRKHLMSITRQSCQSIWSQFVNGKLQIYLQRVSDASGNLTFTKVKETNISLQDLRSDVSVEWFISRYN